MNEFQRDVLKHLKRYHTGESSAIHGKELADRFQIEVRTLQYAIHRLRLEGYPVCSSKNGYFYAASQREINATIGRLNRMLTSVSNARTGLLYACLLMPDFKALECDRVVG